MNRGRNLQDLISTTFKFHDNVLHPLLLVMPQMVLVLYTTRLSRAHMLFYKKSLRILIKYLVDFQNLILLEANFYNCDPP